MDGLVAHPKYTRETLSPGESFWRDRNAWFQEMGYHFRPRYQPEWVASWVRNPKLVAYNQEDYHGFPFLGLDAKRIVDGTTTPVYIKRIADGDFQTETEMTQYFHSTPTLLSDPENHCVPVLEVLTTSDEPPVKLMVLPYLIPWDGPKFYTIGEAVDFFEQIFEGLKFIHAQGVAHGDAKINNIMIEDGLKLYKTPPHPTNPFLTAEGNDMVKTYSRTKHPVKYTFIDYNLSFRCSPNEEPIRAGWWGGDKSVPEFKTQAQSNPFFVDVYCIGNVIRENFTHGSKLPLRPKRGGFQFMEALLEEMCNPDPTKRPTMDVVVDKFQTIKHSLSSVKLRSRIADVDERPIQAFRRDMKHAFRVARDGIFLRPAIPDYRK